MLQPAIYAGKNRKTFAALQPTTNKYGRLFSLPSPVGFAGKVAARTTQQVKISAFSSLLPKDLLILQLVSHIFFHRNSFQPLEKQNVVFDIHQIMDLLPHRYPFLLVDKIISFEDETIEGIKNVTINEPFFMGHFPNNPIMPGVLQIEAMAQVGGIMLMNKVEDYRKVWVYILGIDNARFKKPVKPGDVLHFKLKMEMFRRGICKMHGDAYVDGELVCTADLMASVVPKEQ